MLRDSDISDLSGGASTTRQRLICVLRCQIKGEMNNCLVEAQQDNCSFHQNNIPFNPFITRTSLSILLKVFTHHMHHRRTTPSRQLEDAIFTSAIFETCLAKHTRHLVTTVLTDALDFHLPVGNRMPNIDGKRPSVMNSSRWICPRLTPLASSLPFPGQFCRNRTDS
jgi:hypothetical protein